jgi:hypothetical protein
LNIKTIGYVPSDCVFSFSGLNSHLRVPTIATKTANGTRRAWAKINDILKERAIRKKAERSMKAPPLLFFERYPAIKNRLKQKKFNIAVNSVSPNPPKSTTELFPLLLPV